jgi:threonine aldolase
MRAAMAAADVGDDVYAEDPTVNRLQARAADIFGKEAALFVPSGTMGNQIAIRVHTNPGQEVITELHAHIYEFEMAAMAAISGVLARPVPAPDGILDWERIRAAIRPKIYYRAQTGLIALENTNNMAGGTVYSASQIEKICDGAHEAGLPVHLDGARIFNAATALGTGVPELCSPADSVMFCLSKGLCAPVGSMLVGPADFIVYARRLRKTLGGGMRQVGILAAAGLIALEDMPGRLAEDHARAKRLAEAIHGLRGILLEPAEVETNILIFGFDDRALTVGGLLDKLRAKGILALAVAGGVRMVTHKDVGDDDVARAIAAFGAILG